MATNTMPAMDFETKNLCKQTLIWTGLVMNLQTSGQNSSTAGPAVPSPTPYTMAPISTVLGLGRGLTGRRGLRGFERLKDHGQSSSNADVQGGCRISEKACTLHLRSLDQDSIGVPEHLCVSCFALPAAVVVVGNDADDAGACYCYCYHYS